MDRFSGRVNDRKVRRYALRAQNFETGRRFSLMGFLEVVLTTLLIYQMNSTDFLKKLFSDSGSPEGAPQMAAGPNLSILRGSCATARIASYLQSRRPRGHRIHCKYAVVLFGGRARTRRSVHGTFSASWRLLGCSQGPQEKVLQIRGGHQDGHQLD